MNIALDWDGTFTRDPELWGKFIYLCKKSGHDIRIVTARYAEETDEYLTAIGKTTPVIFTNRMQKRLHCDEIGWQPDIWIDDTPEFIVRPDVLNFIEKFSGPNSGIWDEESEGKRGQR